jgi:cytochrome c-type biogenesis protein CcmH
MLTLWIIFALMILLALYFILPPLLGRRETTPPHEAQAANILIYQDQHKEMEADLKNGLVSEEQFQLDKRELERRLIDDVSPPSADIAGEPKVAFSSRNLAFVLAGALPLAAVLFYLSVGSPKALSSQASVPGPMAASQSGQMTQAQIEANVAKLAKKLEENPNDAQGWTMLARSYMGLERYPDAAAAYERATAMDNSNANLWSDYAEALAMANGRKMAGKPLEAALRALQLDPKNERALVLAGSAAYEVGDYPKAIDYWQKLLTLLPAGSEEARTVSDQIAKARKLATGQESR